MLPPPVADSVNLLVFFTLRRDNVHPHTSSSLDFFTWFHIPSGGVGGVWQRLCALAHVFDAMDYCKDFIPNSVHTKNAKSELLNAWNYGDTIIAMPCGKWFPQFSKHFANETLHLQVTQVKSGRKNERWYLVYTNKVPPLVYHGELLELGILRLGRYPMARGWLSGLTKIASSHIAHIYI